MPVEIIGEWERRSAGTSEELRSKAAASYSRARRRFSALERPCLAGAGRAAEQMALLGAKADKGGPRAFGRSEKLRMLFRGI